MLPSPARTIRLRIRLDTSRKSPFNHALWYYFPMGINVEFTPDLCLRSIEESRNGSRGIEECLPENIREGESYPYLKKGQRHFFLQYEMPLRETKGGGVLSRPLAAVMIREATHFMTEGEIWTRGTYAVSKVIEPGEIYFDGLEPIGRAYSK